MWSRACARRYRCPSPLTTCRASTRRSRPRHGQDGWTSGRLCSRRSPPFAAIGSAAGLTEDEVMERTERLLGERIIREVTPIFDTPALGYESMLVAARVDGEHPHRAAAIINEHPGVSHNYLRNHAFNLWFTIAVPPDSRLGLDGTLEVLKELTGAESMRQLPTITMFKINMNLEMEGGTEKLAATADAVEP